MNKIYMQQLNHPDFKVFPLTSGSFNPSNSYTLTTANNLKQ